MQVKPGVDGGLKLCPACKHCSLGKQEIYRDFGRDNSRADGRRVYCRKCMREGRGRHTKR